MKDIWIIDDDEEMGRAIGLMLKLLDYQAATFISARSAAQALLGGKKPDLMIVDINMPEVSGLELVEFMRRRPEWWDMPVIMLSSEGADTMIERALIAGADTYAKKPVTIEELEGALETAFSKHKIG